MRAGIICLLLSVLAAPSANADEPQCLDYGSRSELANCSYYRSKREHVPVFKESDLSAEVLDTISLGEEVCYIGEQKEFAILDWDKQQIIRAQDFKPTGVKAFVRLVELWEPRRKREADQTISGRLKQFFYYRQSGGVPDDPFWIMRPLLGGFAADAPEKHCVKAQRTPQPK